MIALKHFGYISAIFTGMPEYTLRKIRKKISRIVLTATKSIKVITIAETITEEMVIKEEGKKDAVR